MNKLIYSNLLWASIVLQSPAVHAQTQTPVPAFEVASVRQSPPDHGYTNLSPSGAPRFTATNVSMKILLSMAFGVDDNRIAAKYSWLDSQLYDVVAKPEGERGFTYEELQPMLQTLLKQRFQLSTHRETKNVAGYALVPAKGGGKLEPAKGNAASIYILPDGIQGTGMNMSSLAGVVARPLGRPVIDRTGILGNYDVKLKYAPQGGEDSTLPSIVTAVQEQLGLKLEPQTVPIEMLVVDYIEKVPTEN